MCGFLRYSGPADAKTGDWGGNHLDTRGKPRENGIPAVEKLRTETHSAAGKAPILDDPDSTLLSPRPEIMVGGTTAAFGNTPVVIRTSAWSAKWILAGMWSFWKVPCSNRHDPAAAYPSNPAKLNATASPDPGGR